MATRSRIRAERVARVIVVLVSVVLVAAVTISIIWFVRLVGSGFGGAADIVIVPSVIGLPQADAEERLRSVGLLPQVERYYHNEDQPSGTVYKQQPEEMYKLRQGRKVHLWVSLGPASFTVPVLVGQHIDRVPQTLADAGLRLGTIAKVYNVETPAGEVVNQDPSAGRVFSSSVPVDVVVADRDSLPESGMPSLRGMRLSDVETLLVRNNLRLAKVTYVADDTARSGTIVKQSIPAGDTVALGAGVEVEVAIPTQLKEAHIKTLNIRVSIPLGPPQQQVKVKVFDAAGGQIAYDQVHAPGDLVERRVQVEGKATVFIFVGNMAEPYREERL